MCRRVRCGARWTCASRLISVFCDITLLLWYCTTSVPTKAGMPECRNAGLEVGARGRNGQILPPSARQSEAAWHGKDFFKKRCSGWTRITQGVFENGQVQLNASESVLVLQVAKTSDLPRAVSTDSQASGQMPTQFSPASWWPAGTLIVREQESRIGAGSILRSLSAAR